MSSCLLFSVLRNLNLPFCASECEKELGWCVLQVLQREINSELRKMTRDSICRDNSITETQDSVVISIRWFFTDNDPPRVGRKFLCERIVKWVTHDLWGLT